MFETPFSTSQHADVQQVMEYFLQHLNINGVNDLHDFDLQFFNRCRTMGEKLVFHIVPREEIIC